MGSRSQHYKLKGLSEGQCWSLFEQRAFGGESGEKSPNLVAIGKEIVQKCGGLPLAVNALGSLLYSKGGDEEQWRIIRDSEILKPSDETTILPALRLSYDHLSFQSRRCFAYCSIFPKDYEIYKENLIYLWIANDFILPQRMELEDVGNQIFNELVWRSLLQVEERDEFGKIISCKMHDLLHDLARYVTGNEFFTLKNGEAGVPKETRHLLCVGRIIPKSFCDAQKVRGLFLNYYGARESLDFSNLRWLPLLDLSWCGMEELSSSIGNLVYLKYLDLSWNDFTSLPESVSNLMNLQTLILNNCRHLLELPKGITNGLRHLDVSGCNKLMVMPNKIGQLTSILRVLELSWDEGLNDGEAIQAEETLNNLQPCEKLERLKILRYPGNQFSSWLQASLVLPDLVVVDLHGCYNCQSLPSLGQLPSLKRLRIEVMHAVKYIGVDFYGKDKSQSFPSLQEFTLDGMDNLEEWSFVEDKRKVFPCLNKLTITNLGKLSRFPEGLLRDCTMLKTLELDECRKLRTLGRELNSLVALEWLTIDSSCEEMECLSEEGIQGLTCLRELKIMLFPKLTTISPVLEGLSSLKTIGIWGCQKLMSLPEGIWKLIHLEILKIVGCESLTSFPQDGIGGLTSLKFLLLENLPNLTYLPEEIGGLTSLQVLILGNLPKLTYLPEGIGGLVSLNELSIRSMCRELSNVPLILQRLTTLKKLTLEGFDCLKFLPEGGLASLTELQIIVLGDCKELFNLPATLQRHTTLKVLSLSGFDSLNFLVEGGLPSLEKLEISDCKNLTSLPEEGVRGLTALEVLEIHYCHKLSTLPAALQQLTSLRELTIWGCENLTSLPEEGVRGLTALELLRIRNCKKLSTLPLALQQIPIQILDIYGCHPELLRQVKEKTGEEWLKIKHIQHIHTHFHFSLGFYQRA